MMLAFGVGCGHHVRLPTSVENPQTSFHHAQEELQRGDDLVRAQAEADDGVKRYLSSSPEWARKFRILEAEVVLVRGNDYAQVLRLLDAEPASNGTRDSLIKVLTLKSVALARLQEFDQADLILRQAEALCDALEEVTCGEVFRARGVFLVQRGKPKRAMRSFEKTVVFARLHRDRFLEATARLNLGLGALREQHFDEAVDWTDAAYRLSSALGAGTVAEKALGNLGWAYYYLGDFENARDKSLKAAELATQGGADTDRLTWITVVGNVYASRGDFAAAGQSYQAALDLANKTGGKEAMYDTYRALALASVESGELSQARKYSDAAFDIAHKENNRQNELYPILVNGLIAARMHDGAEAERILREVENDQKANASLRFRAQSTLARLCEDQGRRPAADREYRAALKTIEMFRSTIKREDLKLPFSNNARQVYDDYVHFLVASKKTNEALRWGDFSRARTLKEGLGLLPKGSSVRPSPLDAQQIAQRAGGTVLFYWLGDKQSYLWAITARKTSLFTLPARKEIEDHMHRYSEALKVQNVLASADRDGESLYSMLVSPAQAFLKKDAKVFVIPDGDLNNLNFETLLVSEPNGPKPKLHFWIDDVTIANASSLRVLAAAHVGERKRDRTLLLVGNSVSPNDEYPELPQAAAQVKSVASHFSGAKQKILTREGATASAYLASHPEQVSYIHFVAHGMASRLSPLDSAIVLSKDSARDESFKLYARDIINYSKKNPLLADLVTISACYSSGDRSYSGEGLVGLSWAFLRAGAHNVIAALWNVSDASTVQLMDKFYDSLNKGARPDAALRAAKLSLLHGNEFHNPFYWAPFQLYARLD